MATFGQAQRDELEALIDLGGVEEMLSALVMICNEKADHVMTNWQDRNLARVWQRCAREIDKCQTRIVREGAP